MNPTDYNALVARLEELARRAPRALRRRSIGLVALGYGYVLGVLLLVVVLAVGVIVAAYTTGRGATAAWKIVIALLVIAWIIARSLWITIPAPEGDSLDLRRHPVLARRLEEIRAALGAPRPDMVLLNHDFNASVTQVPRLGIFGWHRTYLTLGLPLMYGLEPRQLDAVLAHEFGHLSGAHPKTGLWVYRVSNTWARLLGQLEETRSAARWMFRRFFEWYVPRLQAHGFVMSRRDEYEADADAARIAGADAMGGALVAVEVRGTTMAEHFWSEIWKQAESQPVPPVEAWATLPRMLKASAPSATIERALERRGLDEDTHPALAQRLEALGLLHDGRVDPWVATQLDRPFAESAAEHYLGGRAREILDALDAEWRTAIREPWEERHAELQRRRCRIEELMALERDGALDTGLAWELARLLGEIGEDATPLLRRVVAEAPDNAGAQFMLGAALLDRKDPAGIPHLERAMELDIEAIVPATSILRRYHTDRGDLAAAERVQWKQYEFSEEMRLAAEERNEVGKKDTLVAPELGEADLAVLREAGAAVERVRALWVVRKMTERLPERPMYVIVVERPRWKWSTGTDADQELAREVLDRIELTHPSEVLVVVLSAYAGWLLRRVKKAPGLLVYTRTTRRPQENESPASTRS